MKRLVLKTHLKVFLLKKLKTLLRMKNTLKEKKENIVE